jgi:predicted nucleic acid-binding protein
MSAPVFVPDASVLLKWVLRSDDEADTRTALALKSAWLDESCDLLLPTLWVFEVGNVLGLKQPAAAPALLQALIDLGIREEPPHEYLSSACGLMRTHGVTFYDAAYHALAIRANGTLLTADRAYERKARRAGHVALLGDWQP